MKGAEDGEAWSLKGMEVLDIGGNWRERDGKDMGFGKVKWSMDGDWWCGWK